MNYESFEQNKKTWKNGIFKWSSVSRFIELPIDNVSKVSHK